MNLLVLIAVVLLILWIVAEAVGLVLGAALHLFWIVALVLFAIWAFQKLRTRV